MSPHAAAPADPPWRASDRLRLREFALSDVSDLARMHQDARVRAQLVDDLALDDLATASGFVAGMQTPTPRPKRRPPALRATSMTGFSLT